VRAPLGYRRAEATEARPRRCAEAVRMCAEVKRRERRVPGRARDEEERVYCGLNLLGCW
jgi:hypothetical protein